MGLVLSFSICASPALVAQTNEPTVEVQPEGGAAAVGETFAFSVAADGTLPLAYQWYFGGTAIASATNASLLLTNLATGAAGSYFAIITNSVGSVTSSVADLFVVTTAPRVLWVQNVAESGSNGVEVPLVLNANGRETSIQGSLHFDTNTVSSPTYEWAPGNLVSVVSSNLGQGELGFTISRPVPELFPAGAQTLGSILFDRLGTNTTALDGGLILTNTPVDVLAADTNGLEMLLSAVVVPQVHTDPVQPALNRQTGLFEQQVMVANPSAGAFLDLPVYVPFLGVDTSTNAMFLFDSDGAADVDLDGDGVAESAAFFTVTNLPPGAVHVVTNGFYVADHATSPVADYYVGIGGTPGVPMPSTTVPLRITLAALEDAGFTIEWSTRPNRIYSINPAGNLADLGDPDLVETSTNTVDGTGSPGRWVDPESAEPSRFYQVIESQ